MDCPRNIHRPTWESVPPRQTPRMILGIDYSTRSLTAVLIDPATGEIACQLSVNIGSDPSP